MERNQILKWYGSGIAVWLLEKIKNEVIIHFTSEEEQSRFPKKFFDHIIALHEKIFIKEYSVDLLFTKSTFNEQRYACCVFNIYDSNEINEKHTIFLITSHNYINIVEYKQLINIVKFIIRSNLLQFKKEISYKRQFLIDHYKKEETQDQIERIDYLIKSIKVEENEKDSAENYTETWNKDRKLIDLFDFPKFEKLIYNYILRYPIENYFQSPSYNKIKLGIENYSLHNVACYSSSSDSKSLYFKLAKNPAMSHITYSLLIGRPFVIVTSNISHFIPLAIRLCSFVPGFSLDSFNIKEEVVPRDLPESSVTICNKISNEGRSNISIFSIDQNLYEGVIAPEDSLVWGMSKMDPTQSAQSFISAAFVYLRKQIDSFELIASQNYESRSDFRDASGFNPCDLHILKAWSHYGGYTHIENLLSTLPPPEVGACFI